MKYALGNMLNGAGGLNADQLALDLQFAADKTLTARKGPNPNFTRASSGTFVGSNGLIQSAGNNVARFDHDPVTLASRGLLIEESRTNLLQRSEEFGNAYWTTVRAAITTDVTTSPDGLTTAEKLIADTTAANNHRVDRPTVTLALNTVHTISIFAKASEYTGLGLGVGLSAVEGVRFSLVGAGTATPVLAGNTGTIQQLANGWYRCTCTFTSDATTAIHRVAISVGQNGTTFSYTGDNTSGIFIWGAQLEAGSFATSYIPTTTSSVVRSADVCSISAVPFATFYNPAGGTIATTQTVNTIPALGLPEACRILGTGGQLQFGSTNFTNEALRFYSVNGGSIKNLRSSTRASGVQFKNAVAFANNNLAACIDGGSVLTDTTSHNIIIGTSMAIGQTPGSMQIARIQYFRKRLPNAKLQALTV